MTEYIERDAISEEIRKYYYKNPPNFSYGAGFDRGLDRAQRAILDAPAADVAPIQKWISVKDKLPEMGEHYQSEDVLVCIDYRPDDPDTTKDSYVSIDHVDFNCFGQGWFSCERDDPRDGEPSPYFVTHWMPLPEPPEEDKK